MKYLKKHEDDNEMHFHEVDRKWIIQAMEEYAGYYLQSEKIKSIMGNLPLHPNQRSGLTP